MEGVYMFCERKIKNGSIYGAFMEIFIYELLPYILPRNGDGVWIIVLFVVKSSLQSR